MIRDFQIQFIQSMLMLSES